MRCELRMGGKVVGANIVLIEVGSHFKQQGKGWQTEKLGRFVRSGPKEGL